MTISSANRRHTDTSFVGSLRRSLRGFVEWAEDVAPPGKVRAGFEFTSTARRVATWVPRGGRTEFERSKWLRPHSPKLAPCAVF